MIAVVGRGRVAHVVRITRDRSEPSSLPASTAAASVGAQELLLRRPRRNAERVGVVVVRPTGVEIRVQGRRPAELLAVVGPAGLLHRSQMLLLLLHVFVHQSVALVAQVAIVRHPPQAHRRVLGAGRVLVVPQVAAAADSAALEHSDGADVAGICVCIPHRRKKQRP